MKRKPKLQNYNVTIDYHTNGFPGTRLTHAKAVSEEDAIAKAVAVLRSEEVNLVIGRTDAALSRWN
jgi:hypothetical protein